MHDPLWYLLAEFSFAGGHGDEVQGVESAAGVLIEVVRALGVPGVHVRRIRETMMAAVANVAGDNDQADTKLPFQVRFFIQREALEGSLRRADRERGEVIQGQKGSARARGGISARQPDPASQSDQGWGHFMIEREMDRPDTGSVSPHYAIEIFLYTEGI